MKRCLFVLMCLLLLSTCIKKRYKYEYPIAEIYVPFIFAGGRQIDVGGWDSSEFGQHIVRLNRTEIYPVGIWPATQFGTAEVSLRGDKIKPPGWDSGVVGEPSIFKPIVAHGWDSMVFQNNTVVYNWIQEIHTYPFLDQPPVPSDKAVVMNRTQYLYMQGGASKAEYGTPKVTNEFQAIKPTMMAPSSKWGTAWLSFSPRTVGPVYFERELERLPSRRKRLPSRQTPALQRKHTTTRQANPVEPPPPPPNANPPAERQPTFLIISAE